MHAQTSAEWARAMQVLHQRTGGLKRVALRGHGNQNSITLSPEFSITNPKKGTQGGDPSIPEEIRFCPSMRVFMTRLLFESNASLVLDACASGAIDSGTSEDRLFPNVQAFVAECLTSLEDRPKHGLG